MIEIEIDGQKIQINDGAMIIEAADAANIPIPRFCYHKKLSIAANCRMCLVEVDKVGKPLPACATPVTPGMKVFTQSAKAIDAQKSVMEFLLINHPLDCPICDQGGQCELQDVAMGYGKDDSRYEENKRSVADEDFGPLVATDMTRCIHCTRCVRFGEEVAGIAEIGLTGRGEQARIGTYIKHSLTSEVSGNIIDVCPVGALTSKPFRFRARAWEMQQHPSIAAHDCLGSNIFYHTHGPQVLRVVPRENEAINSVWLSDRDRFSYAAFNSRERITEPYIKQAGKWEACSWEHALQVVVERLDKVINQYSANQIGALISPNATLEEHFLWQKLWRALGCHNIDHRLQQTDFRDQDRAPLMPLLGCPIEDLEKCDTLFLIGSDIHVEQPAAALRIRQGALKNHTVMALNPYHVDYRFPCSKQLVAHPLLLNTELGKIVKAVLKQTNGQASGDLATWLQKLTPTEQHEQIAQKLIATTHGTIILGALALNHPDVAQCRALVQCLVANTKLTAGEFSNGANSAGAWLAGAVPHRTVGGHAVAQTGLDAITLFQEKLKAYLLFNVEPELDCANPATATAALSEADFVVSFSPFRGGILESQADVILPLVTIAENAGTFINCQGIQQTILPSCAPLNDAKPGWKVLRVLGNLFNKPGFDYSEVSAVTAEINSVAPAQNLAQKTTSEVVWRSPENNTSSVTRITTWPIYRTDNVVRRSVPLQSTVLNKPAAVSMNQQMAARWNLAAGDKALVTQNGISIELLVVIDDALLDNTVMIPAGFSKTAKLGDSFGSIDVKKVESKKG